MSSKCLQKATRKSCTVIMLHLIISSNSNTNFAITKSKYLNKFHVWNGKLLNDFPWRGLPQIIVVLLAKREVVSVIAVCIHTLVIFVHDEATGTVGGQCKWSNSKEKCFCCQLLPWLTVNNHLIQHSWSAHHLCFIVGVKRAGHTAHPHVHLSRLFWD